MIFRLWMWMTQGSSPAVSGGGGAPAYEPSLDFSDERNSQYIPLL